MKHIILYVHSMRTSGGIERVIATLAKVFQNGYRVTVLVKDAPETFYALPLNVQLISLDYPLVLDMGKSRLSRMWSLVSHLSGVRNRLRNSLNDISYDYIYITTPLACLEYYISGLPKEKLIISEHSSRGNFNFVYRIIKRLLYFKYPVQVVPTEIDYKWYIAHGFPSIKIPHFRSNLNYTKSSQQSKIVLNIGRMTDDKQQLRLLCIWESIYSKIEDKDWKLRIVGEGENYAAILQYIDKHQLNNSVEVCPPKADVEDYYDHCSIYASSSQREGFPMVLVEAISFGLPVIAFDCPTGPAEILSNGTGVLIDLNDNKSYVDELVKLINDPQLRLDYSNRAYARSMDWNDEQIFMQWKGILR